MSRESLNVSWETHTQHGSRPLFLCNLCGQMLLLELADELMWKVGIKEECRWGFHRENGRACPWRSYRARKQRGGHKGKRKLMNVRGSGWGQLLQCIYKKNNLGTFGAKQPNVGHQKKLNSCINMMKMYICHDFEMITSSGFGWCTWQR